jgi:hypothetical protein
MSVAASKTICWSGRVNGQNTMCSRIVSRVTVWSNVLPGGQPFIAQIGPPMEISIFRPRSPLHSSRPPAVAIARSSSSSAMGQILFGSQQDTETRPGEHAAIDCGAVVFAVNAGAGA